MKYDFDTRYTCARHISFDIHDGIVTNVKFTGGCNGNLKAIASLVDGMTVEQVAQKCEGITCGFKPTSCSDQLVKALKEARQKELEMKKA